MALSTPLAVVILDAKIRVVIADVVLGMFSVGHCKILTLHKKEKGR